MKPILLIALLLGLGFGMETAIAGAVIKAGDVTISGGAGGGSVDVGDVVSVHGGDDSNEARPAHKPGKSPVDNDDADDADDDELNFANQDLSGADLGGRKLKGANFANANLAGADLAGSDLRGANIVNVNLAQAQLQGANLKGANIVNTSWAGADLSGATWSDGRKCKAGSIGRCR